MAELLAIFLVGLPLGVLGSILNGFTLSVIWGWFMVPTLHLPPISIIEGLGINLVITFLTYQYAEDKRSAGERLATMLISPLFVLVIGWVYHLFM